MKLVVNSLQLCECPNKTHGEVEMRKAVTAGFVGLGLLSACTISPNENERSDLSMNIGAEPTLIGGLYITEAYTGSVYQGLGIRRKSYIKASNFNLSCKSEVMENYEKGPDVSYDLTCDDGSTGVVTLQYRTQGKVWVQGIGQGQMRDGRRVKVLFGPQGNSLDWQ